MKQRIRFIINPKSGVTNKANVPALIEQYLDKTQFESDIVFTNAPKHATTLARTAAEEKYDIAVAVGGDGSVNEVASGLINTNTSLGILALGSGNGFALHYGIKRGARQGLETLNKSKVKIIDTCTLNGQLFVNLAGVGFDGLVAYQLKVSKQRGLIGYTRATIKQALRYQAQSYKIKLDDKVLEETCFFIEVANASTFGYGVKVLPNADSDDGLMDVLIMKKQAKWRYALSLWRLLFNQMEGANFVDTYRVKKIDIIPQEEVPIHFDGEGSFRNEPLSFRIKPKSLKLMIPRH